MRADGHERRVEAALGLLGEQVLDLVVERDLHAHRLDLAHLLHQVGARQAVGGNAEVHHAAGQRPRVADLDGVPQAR